MLFLHELNCCCTGCIIIRKHSTFLSLWVQIELPTQPCKDSHRHNDTETEQTHHQTHHITFCGVDSVSQTFNGDPFDRHLGDPPLSVVVPIVNLLGEPKVGHTHVHILIQPGPEGQVLHCCVIIKYICSCFFVYFMLTTFI